MSCPDNRPVLPCRAGSFRAVPVENSLRLSHIHKHSWSGDATHSAARAEAAAALMTLAVVVAAAIRSDKIRTGPPRPGRQARRSALGTGPDTGQYDHHHRPLTGPRSSRPPPLHTSSSSAAARLSCDAAPSAVQRPSQL